MPKRLRFGNAFELDARVLARHLADRLLRDVPQDNAARIGRAYRLLFGAARRSRLIANFVALPFPHVAGR